MFFYSLTRRGGTKMFMVGDQTFQKMNDFFQQLRLVCPSNREQCSPVIDWRVQIPRIPGEAVPNWQRVSDNNMMAVGWQTGLDLWTHSGKKGKQIAVRDHLWLQVKWDEYKQAEKTQSRSTLLLMPVCSELYSRSQCQLTLSLNKQCIFWH